MENTEIYRREKTETHYKPLWITFLVVLMVIVVGIFTFLDIESLENSRKIYDPTTQTVTIKDALVGLRPIDDIATVRLETPVHNKIFPHNTEINNYAFEMTINNSKSVYQDWLSKMEYYNKDCERCRLKDEITDKGFLYRYYDEDYKWSYNEKTNNCTVDVGKNTTSCIPVIDTIQVIGKWREFNEKADLPVGVIKVRGYYDVGEGEIVEFIPTMFGVRIEEWADFTGLILYERYETGTVDVNIHNGQYIAQTFRTGNTGANETHDFNGLTLSLSDSATTDSWTLDINLTTCNASDDPDFSNVIGQGSILASEITSEKQYNISLNSTQTLTAGTCYAFVMHCGPCDSGHYFILNRHNGGQISGGRSYVYTPGTDWFPQTNYCAFFREYGTNQTGGGGTPPDVSINTPANNTWFNSDDVTFNCSGNDTGSPAGMLNLSLFIGGSENYTLTNTSAAQNLSFETTVNNLAEGYHPFYCTTTDAEGATVTTPLRNISIDITTPTVSITHPTATNYVAKTTMNYTYTETNGKYCWYSTDGGGSNSTNTTIGNNFTSITGTEGSNTWTVYCNDSANNIGEDSVTFTIDSLPPSITNLQNLTWLINNSNSFDFDATDSGLGVDSFYINGSNHFQITKAGVLTNTSSLGVGKIHKFLLSVNDTLNNTNSSIIQVYSRTYKNIYDEINDNSVNLTIWNYTSVNIAVSPKFVMGEDTNELNFNTTTDTSGDNGYLFLRTSNFSRTQPINITMTVNLTCRDYASGTSYSNLTVFGNNIKKSDCVNTNATDYSEWSFTNVGGSSWKVYDDNVYSSTITGTNDFIILKTSATSGGATSQYAVAKVEYVYYEDVSSITATLNNPATNSIFIDKNVTFDINGSVVTGTLKNVSLYIDGIYNDTQTWEGTQNRTTFTKNFNIGNYNWLVKICDNSDFCTNSGTRYFNISGWREENQNFNTQATEGSSETFILNISFNNDSFSNTRGVLVYNGSRYTGTPSVSGNTGGYVVTVNTPDVTGDVNVSFYWEVGLNNGTWNLFNSTSYQQRIIDLGIDDCGAYSVLLLNMTLRDEFDELVKNATFYNSTVEVDVDIYTIGSSTPIIEYSHNYSKNSNPQVCLESYIGNSTYRLDTQIRYDADLYASEFYHIQNFSLTNSSLPQNINLYDLIDTRSQEFKITFKDDNFIAVEDALIQIQRKYINQGVFKTVEIPKTDENGETVGNLELEDVIYTILVTKNGETLGTFNDIRAVCQNPALQNCEINLNTFASSLTVEDYTTGNDFTFTLSYDPDTREIESIYSVPSGTSPEVVLNVTLFDNIGKQEVCSHSLSSSSGTLSCTVPQSFGNSTVIARVSKSGNLMGQSIISMEQEPEDLYGTSIVFLGLFLFLTLIGIGINDNPMITGIFVIIGAILLITMNLIDTGDGGTFIGSGATVLWLIIAVIIILIKGAKRS